MKIKFDWTAAINAVRTAGALMVGNVFVSAVLLGNREWIHLAALLAWGIIVIISTSISRKD